MPYNPKKHHRRSIRLPGYDYTAPGFYFVTFCVQNRVCLFGQIQNKKMRLNEAGQMVDRWWHRLPQKFPTVKTDAWVIMPNHCHGIIQLLSPLAPAPDIPSDPVRADPRVCSGAASPADPGHDAIEPDIHKNISVKRDGYVAGATAGDGEPMGSPLRVRRRDLKNASDDCDGYVAGGTESPSLGRVVQWFKTMTTNEYIRGVKTKQWSPFNKRLWLRNYYERVIRNERALKQIRNYIIENPANWNNDNLHQH